MHRHEVQPADDDTIQQGGDKLSFLAALTNPAGRRTFLKWSGATVAVLTVGCGDDDGDGPMGEDGEVDLGTGDVGVLNYAYALEQLEAAFYSRVVANLYGGASAEERQVLTDIRDHELVHRDFLAAALADAAIKDLEVDFSAVDFDSRESVLTTARTFEDLGVAAYNGAGQLLSDPGNLTIAGKIVSVEARHAAAIRDLLAPLTEAFAGDDVVDPATGLDRADPPSTVVAAADPFIQDELDAGGLPTS